MSGSDNEAAAIRPAAHRCLGIAEVLRNIVRFAGQDRSQNVAAISLSCRLVHDVAQDVLWEKLTTMRDLMRCFPDDVWIPGIQSSIHGHFLRPPAPTEWTRFLANAARVKSFSKTKSYYTGMNVMAWSMLGVYRPVQDIFPNIQRLEWEDDGDGTLAYAHLLITNKLQSVVLHKHDEDEFAKLNLFLDSITNLRPPLREFRLNLPPEYPEEVDDIMSTLILSTRSTLEIYDSDVSPDRAAVVHLAKLPSLKIAKVYSSFKGLHDTAAIQMLGNQIFPTIETLHVDVLAMRGPFNLAIASKSISTKLTDLSVTWHEDPRQASVYEFFDTLGRRPEPRRVRKLSFSPSREIFPPYRQSAADVHRRQPSCEIGLQTLRLLYQLPCLTHLHITSYFLVIDDHTIQQLVAHLPQLESLLLLPGFYGEEHALRATPNSIVYAAHNLPCLRALGFPVDFSQPVSVNVERRMLYNQSCTVLNFAHSLLPPDKVNPVASLLSCHFWHPLLRIIAFDPEIGGNHGYLRGIQLPEQRRLWESCRSTVRLLSEVRRQERERHDCLHFPMAQSYPEPRLGPGSDISWPLPVGLEN